MHKLRRCFMSDDPAKKARWLHRLNLTHFCLAGCMALVATTVARALPQQAEVLSYEGQTVSSVELAGRPDSESGEWIPLIAQRSGEPLSRANLDATIAALKSTGQFRDVQLDMRPEQDGVRLLFVLQPAVYFGMYDFQGAGPFSYSRLLQAANYSSREPYSSVDVQRAETALETFLRRNGYFESEVHAEVKIDTANRLAK